MPDNRGPTIGENLQFLEELWEAHRDEADKLPDDWSSFFRRWQFDTASSNGEQTAMPPVPDSSPPAEVAAEPALEPAIPAEPASVSSQAQLAVKVCRLIQAYRSRGHLAANLDPLGRPRPEVPDLALAAFKLSAADLTEPVPNFSRTGQVTLEELVAELKQLYCATVGYQFSHLDLKPARWLLRQIERKPRPAVSKKTQRRILSRLVAAHGFEQFVRKRYVGAKTFSLAGSETLLPLLDTLIEQAADAGAFEIVLGMAHRGRLNVLVNILGQRPRDIFRELEDVEASGHHGSGDVRYHLGYSTDWLSQEGDRIHVSLSFNPSHLEFVNPVALGRMRAKQQRAGDATRKTGMAVLLHGDASFIGEGVVQESLNLAQLAGYSTGGTIHVVIDNQLGFTTDPLEARSTTYSSDIALAFAAPVFHVNGDDAEAASRVARLAVRYRQRFGSDVVINLHCFRRWGHNESDEPAFTQPQMYRLIESHPAAPEVYADQLRDSGRVPDRLISRLTSKYEARLQSELAAAGRTRSAPRTSSLGGVWSGYVGGQEPADDQPETGVPAKQLQELLATLSKVPAGFHVHSKLAKGLANRGEMLAGKRPLDWATCEMLAIASLAVEGRPVRLTGQDTARGTFSQRHAVWHDTQTGATYMPVANLAQNQAPVEIINSPLCETAALGFEYGYSLDYPEALVAWEAQFGDFWNAAQVIFDQFVASAEDKWSRLSGLVMLLPHSFEGQGPEHSSARLERFLTQAANNNYQVVVPSTPGQYFHCLRRQVLRRWRKPLIILTPKSLLRHHQVVSKWEDLEAGSFQPILSEPAPASQSVSRVLLSMGKFYYELAEQRAEKVRRNVALVRIEQFYPFPADALRQALAPFPPETEVLWCQEEPANMGAWRYMQAIWPDALPARPPLVGVTRRESASPATGSHAVHRREQQDLILRAFE
jgi:2-oxoglutarate dehydrogenase E1 component